MAYPRWDTLNLPAPKIQGYGYTADAGLIRSEMDGGYGIQRRRYQHYPHRFRVTFEASSAELQSIMRTIDTYGYDWLYMPLMSGANGMPKLADHVVRFVTNASVAATAWDLYEVSAELEMEEATPGCTLVAFCDDYLACLLAIDIDPLVVSQQDWQIIADAWGDSTYWGMLNG